MINNNNDNKKRNRDIFENKNNNNSCNNNEYNIKIYNSVFNNKYLKKIIFYHLNIFNILFSVNIKFTSIKEWNQFKYKQYLSKVTLDFKEEDYDLNQLPENINHLSIRPPLNIVSVPFHIESISYIGKKEFTCIEDLYKQPFSSKIKSLSLIFHFTKLEEIQSKSLPDSIKELDIYFNKDNQIELDKILPPSLKKLSIYDLNSTIEKSFPIKSLTNMYIDNSHPSFINQLSSNNLIKLVFTNYIDLDSNIKFPDSLQHLVINCNSFNSKLPTNLKSLELSMQMYQSFIQFPSSLEYLAITYRNNLLNRREMFEYREELPSNLKTLEFTSSSILDDNGQSILSNTLEKLVFNNQKAFNQELKVNQLPSSLTYLDLGESFNQVIEVNVLPENLNTLILGEEYTQIINPKAIPQQLKLLEIYNDNYPHLINLISTHPHTSVSTYSNIGIYYQGLSSNFNKIHALRLPLTFNSPLSTLHLQNKSNLEYLHLGFDFSYSIQLSDLPIQNNIKTLVLSNDFCQTINLEFFQNLETIIIDQVYGLFESPKITTTTTTTSTIIDNIQQQQQHIHYNNYSLKSITISPKNTQFLKQLDLNFYQFLKYKNNKQR